MTRDDRESEVRDYIRYLNRVALFAEEGVEGTGRTLLGFSRGHTLPLAGRFSGACGSAVSFSGALGSRKTFRKMLRLGFGARGWCWSGGRRIHFAGPMTSDRMRTGFGRTRFRSGFASIVAATRSWAVCWRNSWPSKAKAYSAPRPSSLARAIAVPA